MKSIGSPSRCTGFAPSGDRVGAVPDLGMLSLQVPQQVHDPLLLKDFSAWADTPARGLATRPPRSGLPSTTARINRAP